MRWACPGVVSAGRLAKTLKVLGQRVTVLQFTGDVWGNRAAGQSYPEAVARAGLKTGGSVAGGALGGAACVGLGISTLGVGLVACPALVFAGSYGGGEIGDNSYDWGANAIDSATQTRDRAGGLLQDLEYRVEHWWDPR